MVDAPRHGLTREVRLVESKQAALLKSKKVCRGLLRSNQFTHHWHWLFSHAPEIPSRSKAILVRLPEDHLEMYIVIIVQSLEIDSISKNIIFSFF